MPARTSRTTFGFLPAAAVAFAAIVVTAVLFGRVSWRDWTQPVWLEGDPLEVYARVRAASEQPAHALVAFDRLDRLGAPSGADWSAYPVPDKPVFALAGLLARAAGVVGAVHLIAAALAALNAASFFLAARWLRWRIEWAAALALAFAFCSYNLRWGVTLSLSQTFTLPPLVLLCARAARPGAAPALSRGWNVFGLALGTWLGLGNPYLAFFAGIVGGGALALALARRAAKPRLLPLVAFLAALSVVFAAANAGYFRQLWLATDHSALRRGAGDFQAYALRPLEWLVPPSDHRVDPLASIGRAYAAARGAGEPFYNYLGLAGIAGLVALLAAQAVRLARRRWSRIDPLLGFGWIMAFAVAGGVNNWLAAAGLDVFRAGNRIGVFGVLWALFALGGRLNRSTRRLRRSASMILAAGVAVVACWEQTPPLASAAARETNASRLRAYEELSASLAAQLGRTAAVFQLPVTPFPEAGRTGAMPDYEHLLPFVASDALRFSSGSLAGSPALRWARHVAGLPAAAMAAELERTGFSALWVDTRGPDGRNDALAGALRALGRDEMPVPARLPIRVFRLQPVDPAAPPDYSDPRLADPWDDRPVAEGSPRLLALDGWYAPERDGGRRWRWARRQARAGLWLDGAERTVRLSFRFGGVPGGTLVLRAGGREVWRGRVAAVTDPPQTVVLPARPGLTELTWELDGRLFRPGGGDARELGFAIENLTVAP